MASFTHYAVKNHIQIPILSEESSSYSNDYDYITNLKNNLQIKIVFLSDDEIIFDLIGVDASIANALRRIIIAEIPTVAIETVYIMNNTSIIHDEVLSHRLGLIPIFVSDLNKLDNYRKGDDETTSDTLVFKLDVECSQMKDSNEYFNKFVYSNQLQWMPMGNQQELFPDGISPVHSDIMIAELRPGHKIELEAHAYKGIAKDHAKFSPVATCSYRLLPDISIPNSITGEEAYQLRDLCPLQVFDIEDIQGVPTAKVSRPRDCTMCRECIRKEGWEEKVQLKRKANHYIFSIESVGQIPPIDIVRQGIAILKQKSVNFFNLVENYENGL